MGCQTSGLACISGSHLYDSWDALCAWEPCAGESFPGYTFSSLYFFIYLFCSDKSNSNRYLKPQGLADTVCGSPLYMAPEIIQGKKYDAKVLGHSLTLRNYLWQGFCTYVSFFHFLNCYMQADLWSVGAILFQLITGKPPFGGNNEYQVFIWT